MRARALRTVSFGVADRGPNWIAHAFLQLARGMYTHDAPAGKNKHHPPFWRGESSSEVIVGVAILLGWYNPRQWLRPAYFP